MLRAFFVSNRRIPPLRVVLLVVIPLVVAGCAQITQQFTGAANKCPPGFDNNPGLGPTKAAANGLFEVCLSDGSTVFTHGADNAGQVDPCFEGLAQARAQGLDCPPGGLTGGALANQPLRNPFCVADPVNDYRIEVVYVVAKNGINNYTKYVPSIRAAVQQADGFLTNESLSATGITMDYRVKCANGVIDVANVTSAYTTTTLSFSNLVSDLKAKGYNSALVKYWVFVDKNAGAAGLSTIQSDDRAIADNLNNKGPSYSVATATTIISTSQAMHELTHAMGGVQKSAPFSSNAWHCNDANDIMCYKDGGSNASVLTTLCADRTYYDCSRTAYFNPAPPAGTYLATHWNLGSSINRFTTSAPGIDLRIGSVGVGPASPASGEAVTLSITVANRGGADAGPSTLRVLMDGVALGDFSVPALTARQTAIIPVPWTATTTGSHSYKASADILNEVAESAGFEPNNDFSDIISVS